MSIASRSNRIFIWLAMQHLGGDARYRGASMEYIIDVGLPPGTKPVRMLPGRKGDGGWGLYWKIALIYT